MTVLTEPENSCARESAKRIADRVRALGGCAACKNRAVSWGLIHCGLQAQREFPGCIDSDFTLDEAAITRAA